MNKEKLKKLRLASEHVNHLYVRRNSDIVAEKLIDIQELSPYHREDELETSTLFITGLSQVGKTELVSHIANYKLKDKKDICHVKLDITCGEKSQWLDVLNTIRDGIVEETGFSMPLSEYISNSLEGGRDKVEINWKDKIKLLKFRMIPVIFVFSYIVFIVMTNFSLLEEFLEAIYTKFENNEGIPLDLALTVISILFIPAYGYFSGFFKYFFNKIKSTNAFNVIFGAERLYVSGLSKAVDIDISFDNDHISIDCFNEIKTYMDVFSRELTNNLNKNKNVFFLFTLKVREDGFNYENEKVFDAIKLLVDVKVGDKTKDNIKFIVISKRYHTLNRLGSKAGKICDIELFTVTESFKYLCKILWERQKSSKLLNSPVSDLWRQLSQSFDEILQLIPDGTIFFEKRNLNVDIISFITYFEEIKNECVFYNLNTTNDIKNRTTHLLSEVDLGIKVLTEIVEGTEGKDCSGSLPFEIQQQLHAFETDFQGKKFDDLIYALENHLVNHVSKRISDWDIEYIKNNTFNGDDYKSHYLKQNKLLIKYIELWKQIQTSYRLESIVGIVDEKELKIKLCNTISLLISVPGELHGYIGLRLNGFLHENSDFLSLDSNLFNKFKYASGIFTSDDKGSDVGFFRQEYIDYLAFGNTCTKETVWGLRNLFVELIRDTEKERNLHLLPYTLSVLESLVLSEALLDKQEGFNKTFNVDWKQGVFNHTSFENLVVLLSKCYFKEEERKRLCLDDFNKSIGIFCRVILAALTRRYESFGNIDNDRHLCYQLRLNIESISAIKAVEILIGFLENNTHTKIFNDIGLIKYFYRICRPQNEGFDNCFDNFKHISRTSQLSGLIECQLVPIVCNIMVARNTSNLEDISFSGNGSEVTLCDEEIQELDLLNEIGFHDLCQLKKAYYNRYNDYDCQYLNELFEDYIDRFYKNKSLDSYLGITDGMDFSLAISTLRKIANSLAYSLVSKANKLLNKVPDYESDVSLLPSWELDSETIELIISANTIVDKVKDLFFDFLKDTNINKEQQFVIKSQLMTMLVFFEKELERFSCSEINVLEHPLLENKYSLVKYYVKDSLMAYVEICRDPFIYNSEIRNIFEQKRKSSFVHIQDELFVSLVYKEGKFYSSLTEWFLDDDARSSLIFRVLCVENNRFELTPDILWGIFTDWQEKNTKEDIILFSQNLMQYIGYAVSDKKMSQVVVKSYLGGDIFSIVDMLFSIENISIEVRHQISVFCFSLSHRFYGFSTDQKYRIKKQWATTLMEMFVGLNGYISISRGLEPVCELDKDKLSLITETLAMFCLSVEKPLQL